MGDNSDTASEVKRLIDDAKKQLKSFKLIVSQSERDSLEVALGNIGEAADKLSSLLTKAINTATSLKSRVAKLEARTADALEESRDGNSATKILERAAPEAKEAESEAKALYGQVDSALDSAKSIARVGTA